MNALDILMKARGLIDKGWKQGGYCTLGNNIFGTPDCYCAMGALNVAAGRGSSSFDPVCADRDGDPHERACFFLANAVTGEFADVPDVIDFNDREETKKDDVLKAFDVAISNWRRRKTTSAPLRTAR